MLVPGLADVCLVAAVGVAVGRLASGRFCLAGLGAARGLAWTLLGGVLAGGVLVGVWSAGAVAALIGIGAIRDGIITPTINLDAPDLPDCDLDYVPRVARKAKVDTAIVNGFGFGGQNAVAVFRRFEE